MEELLHGDTRWLEGPAGPILQGAEIVRGITSEDEEEQLATLNDWMEEHGLPRGVLSYDHADDETGEQIAVFDLAWPNGIQEELSQPVVVLLNEAAETLALASQAGYRCFENIAGFRRYVQSDILVEAALV